MGISGRGKGRGSERPSWPEEGGTDLSTLPSFWPEQRTQAVLAEASRASWREPAGEDLEPLWERWFERAVEEGVEEDLASLGRSVIRECRTQRWGEERRAECGWFDDGDAMLELALVDPEQAEERWRLLLDDC
jgi:hypothetical protein